MRSPNYDASYKISTCEEYYSRIASGDKINKSDFAKEKNLKYTTFLTWLDIYREYQLNRESDGAILTSSTPDVKVPRFIEISERTIEDIDNKSKPDTGKVVLKYKDIALEFDGSCLDKALEIIRRW